MQQSKPQTHVDTLVRRVHNAKKPLTKLKALQGLIVDHGLTKKQLSAYNIVQPPALTDSSAVIAALDVQLSYNFHLDVYTYIGINITQDQVNFRYRTRTRAPQYVKPKSSDIVYVSKYYTLRKNKTWYMHAIVDGEPQVTNTGLRNMSDATAKCDVTCDLLTQSGSKVVRK